MLEDAIESNLEAEFPVRTDWRTGKAMVERDDAFWREHERRRQELGMSVRQYCAAHDLALSTFRHRVSGRKRTGSKAAPSSLVTAPKAPSFIAVTAPRDEADTHDAHVEIALDGMTLRLRGGAADRVVARVLDRLA